MRNLFCFLSLIALWVIDSSSAFLVPTTGTTSSPIIYHDPSTARTEYSSDERRKIAPVVLSSKAQAGDDDDGRMSKSFLSNLSFNPFYGGLWASFLVYGLLLSPGDVGSATDNAMIQAYIDNPTAPIGINPLFLCIFNGLGLMPLIMTQLILPLEASATTSENEDDRGLPAAPFCAASMAMGYGSVGCYLTFRKQVAATTRTLIQDDLGWITRNIWENKVVNGGLVLLFFTTILSSGVLDYTSWQDTWNGFVALSGTSKFVAVSSVDLTILTVIAATLIPQDYELRQKDDDSMSNVNLLAASTIALPILGAAIYCLIRPPLPEE